ncbi:MAG: NfeD family protein [Methylocapsa sp.]|nr:NfeD family protein [Methylocapsa sp.]
MEGIGNPATIFFIAGLVLLGIDVFVIGLSPLMFLAAGALGASAILYLSGWQGGILHLAGWEPGFLEGLALCATLSLVIAIFGRRPLQAFQNAGIKEDKSSDLIGRELVTTQQVTKTEGFIYWSGTPWQARLAASARIDHLGPGVRVKVVEIKNLALILSPLD